MQIKRLGLYLFVAMVLSFGVEAQMFGNTTQSEAFDTGMFVTSRKEKIATDDEIEKELDDEKKLMELERIKNETFLPGGGLDIIERDTEDGSERGGAAVVEIDEKGNSRAVEKIFLYYDDFRVSGGKNPTCDMRFYVLPNLNRKLHSLDVKLVWPNMTTTLSFSGVSPNTLTYMNYTLVGDGCYSMDRMPNIIVNRCRVKGMSSVDCANRIVWLNKSSGK